MTAEQEKLLQLKEVAIDVEGKRVLQKINLTISPGEVHALLGPNASGKTTLAQTIMGLPPGHLAEGEILYRGERLDQLPPEERARRGIALVYQHPPVVKGVKLSTLLSKVARRSVDIDNFPMEKPMLERQVNLGFSGGERKLAELLQVISMDPALVILDELDAGLDLEKLNELVAVIRKQLINREVALLVVTHRGNILRFLSPKMTHVLLNGQLICSSTDWDKVWRTITNYGYERCKTCQLSTS